jgi:N-acetylmuramoyl-L-alanine amidase
VKDIRLGVTAERTRLVLDLGAKVDFDIFLLDRPRRVVVDLPSLAWPTDQPTVDGLVQKIRFGQFTADKSRLVIDAKGPVRVAKSFLLPPSSGLPHRLVIDLVKTGNKEFADQVAKDRAAKRSANKAAPAPTPFTPKPRKQANSKPVIVLDAGHGGVDPGALGRKAREKSVTLNFTRELAKQLRKTGKYKVYLTRNRDIYIPLRQRVNIARKHNADLFISIHADAIKRKNVRGMSIYTLSETASDKEAAALAKKENQSDIIAGIDFADQPPEVANILIDLAQRETKNLSVKFANLVVDNARGKTRLLDRTHRFAGFRVLKAPDVPSVLIELGFLTNRSDEKQLLSTAWRRKVAGALVNSVNGFFDASRLAALR